MIKKMTFVLLISVTLAGIQAVSAFEALDEHAIKQELVRDNLLHHSVLTQ